MKIFLWILIVAAAGLAGFAGWFFVVKPKMDAAKADGTTDTSTGTSGATAGGGSGPGNTNTGSGATDPTLFPKKDNTGIINKDHTVLTPPIQAPDGRMLYYKAFWANDTGSGTEYYDANDKLINNLSAGDKLIISSKEKLNKMSA